MDLVVRPFQWKGIASNERNFVRDACQFHFGMQAREKNPDFEESSEDHDSDKDGIPDELSVGDVSALTIFTMTIRPPFEVQPVRDDERRAVSTGPEDLPGRGSVHQGGLLRRCHIPSLHLNDSIVVVRDPRKDIKKYGPEQLVGNMAGLSAQFKSSAQLPVVRRFLDLNPVATVKGREHRFGPRRAAPGAVPIRGAVLPAGGQAGRRLRVRLDDVAAGQPRPGGESRSTRQPLSETQPRLPPMARRSMCRCSATCAGTRWVRDCREHDGFHQKTDVAGITVSGGRVPDPAALGRRRHRPLAPRRPCPVPEGGHPAARVRGERGQRRHRGVPQAEPGGPGGHHQFPAVPTAAARPPLRVRRLSLRACVNRLGPGRASVPAVSRSASTVSRPIGDAHCDVFSESSVSRTSLNQGRKPRQASRGQIRFPVFKFENREPDLSATALMTFMISPGSRGWGSRDDRAD